MIFNKIRISGLKTIDFPLTGLNFSSPYILKSVSGLGPPDVDVILPNALYEGGVYQGAHSLNRNITFKIGLNPDYSLGKSISNLREDLYWLLEHEFTQGNAIQLVNDNTVIAETIGYVSKFDLDPFSKKQEVIVTFECKGSFFISPNLVTHTGSAYSQTFTAQGTARAPFYMEAKVVANTSSIFLVRRKPNVATNQNIIAIYAYGFQTNDIIKFDSTPGNRSILLTRGSTTKSILGYLSRYTIWPFLDPGVPNEILTLGDGYASNQAIFQKLSYNPRYWGI